MISAPNRIHPLSNADLYGPEPLTARTALEAVNLGDVLKPTIDSAGNWITTPATSIDGMDKRVVRAALLTGQLSVSDLMEPEVAK
jgi:hypothetical protein